MKKKRAAYFHPKSLVDSKKDVGSGTSVWAFAHVMKGARVGRDSSLGDHSFVEGGARIGDRVTVKNGVSVWKGVTIEDDAFIGPNAAFTNDLWPMSRNPGFTLTPTRLRRGASIGANATVVCGVTVGEFALVGAGAVVTRDLPAYALAYGSPARVRGWVCRCRRKLRFSAAKARCACGISYRKTKNTVVPVRGR